MHTFFFKILFVFFYVLSVLCFNYHVFIIGRHDSKQLCWCLIFCAHSFSCPFLYRKKVIAISWRSHDMRMSALSQSSDIMQLLSQLHNYIISKSLCDKSGHSYVTMISPWYLWFLLWGLSVKNQSCNKNTYKKMFVILAFQ